MNSNSLAAQMKDPKVVLSTLWIFATLNYIYNDVFGLFFNAAAQKTTLAMGQGPALAFAVLMETAMAMVVLSRLLKYGANRWVNIIAGILHTALVAWSLTGETPLPYCVFFSGIEIVCTLFIVGYAWRWRSSESQPALQAARAH
jgi:hypothetical protein